MSVTSVDRDVHYEIEQFLYREAALLDEGRLDEWLDLFSDDVHYWMPVRETIQGELEGIAPEGELALSLFDDNKEFLVMRVKRLDTGLAHAERPPSRTRHLISNVRAESNGNGEFIVHSNFLLFQARLETSDHFFLGRREDRLRKSSDQWKIASRKIILDHTLLPRALTVFF